MQNLQRQKRDVDVQMSLSGHLTKVEKRPAEVPRFPYSMPWYSVAGTSTLSPPIASIPPLIIALGSKGKKLHRRSVRP